MIPNIFDKFEKKRRDSGIVLDKSSSTATPNNDAVSINAPDKRGAQSDNHHAAAVSTVRCYTCLRYGPNDRYCGHKLRHIKANEHEICAGCGYSPKGSVWKELQS